MTGDVAAEEVDVLAAESGVARSDEMSRVGLVTCTVGVVLDRLNERSVAPPVRGVDGSPGILIPKEGDRWARASPPGSASLPEGRVGVSACAAAEDDIADGLSGVERLVGGEDMRPLVLQAFGYLLLGSVM